MSYEGTTYRHTDIQTYRHTDRQTEPNYDIDVPVHEAIDVCADLLFSKTIIENMDKDTFKILAKLASCNVLISTHDGYFKQIDGLAMGSAPAPHLANGWLSSFDKVIKGNSTLYYRYMDDIITIENNNNIDDKLKHINSLHPF